MNVPEIDQIGEKTREGIKWTFILRFLQKFVLFGTGIILARVLTPKDFGLSAMSIVLDTITWLILSLSINSAIVHFQDKVEERLNAAFWMMIIAGTLLTLAQVAVAPFVAKFYKEPILNDIIVVSALSLFINSFGTVQRTLLTKTIDFKKISVIESTINIFRSVLFVIFALLGFKVWSFIYPKVIVSIVNVIWLWKASDFRPKFRAYFHHWKEMFNYGKSVLLSGTIEFVLSNFNYIFVGGYIGSTALGLYSFAYDKSMMAVSNIAYPLSMIAFPAYARLQNETEKLKTHFYKTIKTISLLSIPYSMFVIAVGPQMVRFFYGEKWIGAILIFQIILFYSMFRSITHFATPLLQAIGKQDLVLRWNLVFAPVYIASIFLGYKVEGVIGIAVAASSLGVLGSFVYLYILAKSQEWSFKEVTNNIMPAMVSGVGLFLILLPFKKFLEMRHFPDVSIILASMILASILYILILRFVFEDTFRMVLSDVAKSIKKKEAQNTEA